MRRIGTCWYFASITGCEFFQRIETGNKYMNHSLKMQNGSMIRHIRNSTFQTETFSGRAPFYAVDSGIGRQVPVVTGMRLVGETGLRRIARLGSRYPCSAFLRSPLIGCTSLLRQNCKHSFFVRMRRIRASTSRACKQKTFA